jgi:hypothetical protein
MNRLSKARDGTLEDRLALLCSQLRFALFLLAAIGLYGILLLFPIDWPEPFGLVMIEAMACGTPVIAFKSGSVPEVIDDGITGFVVSGEAEAVEAIGRLSELDRRQVRTHFEKRFTSRRMAEEYVGSYNGLVRPEAAEAHPGVRCPYPTFGVRSPPLAVNPARTRFYAPTLPSNRVAPLFPAAISVTAIP